MTPAMKQLQATIETNLQQNKQELVLLKQQLDITEVYMNRPEEDGEDNLRAIEMKILHAQVEQHHAFTTQLNLLSDLAQQVAALPVLPYVESFQPPDATTSPSPPFPPQQPPPQKKGGSGVVLEHPCIALVIPSSQPNQLTIETRNAIIKAMDSCLLQWEKELEDLREKEKEAYLTRPDITEEYNALANYQDEKIQTLKTALLKFRHYCDATGQP